MQIRTIVINGILAALYIAVSFLIQPLVFGSFQFRIPEMFNHLIIFNKKYFYGIVIGVFFTNLFSPLGILDLIFGVGQSVLALLISIAIVKYFKTIWIKMLITTAVFSFTMFFIAIELEIAFGVPFLFGWLTTALSELSVMAIGAPLIYLLNKRLQFEKLI